MEKLKTFKRKMLQNAKRRRRRRDEVSEAVARHKKYMLVKAKPWSRILEREKKIIRPQNPVQVYYLCCEGAGVMEGGGERAGGGREFLKLLNSHHAHGWRSKPECPRLEREPPTHTDSICWARAGRQIKVASSSVRIMRERSKGGKLLNYWGQHSTKGNGKKRKKRKCT